MNLDSVIERFSQEQNAFDCKGEKLYPFDVVIFNTYKGNYSKVIDIGAIEDIVFQDNAAYVKICGNPDYKNSESLLKIKETFFQDVNTCKQNAIDMLNKKRALGTVPLYLTGFFKIIPADISRYDDSYAETSGIFQIRLDVQVEDNQVMKNEHSEFTSEIIENASLAFVKWLKKFHADHGNIKLKMAFPTRSNNFGILSRKTKWMDLNETNSQRISPGKYDAFNRGYLFSADTRPFEEENVFIELIANRTGKNTTALKEYQDEALRKAQSKTKQKIYSDKFLMATLDENFKNAEIIPICRDTWKNPSDGHGRINAVITKFAKALDTETNTNFFSEDSMKMSKEMYKNLCSNLYKLSKYVYEMI